MDCKITSPVKRRARGFTYVEFLVASALGVIVAGTLVAFSLYSGRSILAMSNCLELDAQSRTALDTMVWQIRQTQGVSAFTTNSISLTDYDNKTLTFSYDPSAKKLTRTKGTESTVLLKGCDALSFNMFSRDPNDGSWDLNPTTDRTQCKAVFISWNCSRKFVETKLNTESMTSATVVIRNK